MKGARHKRTNIGEAFGVVRFMETENRRVIPRAWRERDRSQCLMGPEFRFGVMKKFSRWIVVTVAQHWGCT